MSQREITVVRGDGIGPSIVDATLQVLDAVGAGLGYRQVDVGQAALEAGDDVLPQKALDAIAETGVVLKGPVTTPSGGGYSSVNVALRKRFDMYANVRPVLSFEGAVSRYDNVDIVVVRENTEGMYSGEGQTLSEDRSRAEALSVITRRECERIVRFAFEFARNQGHRKVTITHKANILKTTSGMFLEVGRKLAEEYPDLEHEELIVDACAMRLVMDPGRFDVIVTTNLFGDIISDLCAGLVGGLGLAPGANIGDDYAMFEAVHGSAPDIADRNIANPTALILAAALMLDHLGKTEAAARIRNAIRGVIADHDRVTPDLGGEGTTTGYTQALIERL